MARVLIWMTTALFQSMLIACTKKAAETGHSPPGSDLLYLQLEHNIGRLGQFVPRGAIQFKAVKSISGTFVQQSRLTHEDIMSLKSMAELGEIYRLRTRSTLSSAISEEENVDFVSTTAKACLLVQSGLIETITVHKDEAGNVFGLSLSIPGLACEFSKPPMKGSLPGIFNTTVVVSHGIQGPTPDTQAFIQQIEKEKKQKEQGQDNRSFVQKYWMYIVPGVIMFIIMSNLQDQGRQAE